MKANTIIALAAGAAILACIKKQKGTSGVGIVEYTNFDGAQIISKDGKHAIEINVHLYPEYDAIEVRSYDRSGGRNGHYWEYYDDLGTFYDNDPRAWQKILRAIRKHWDMRGIKYSEKDLAKL